jgi:hypothetical protein
MSTKVYNAKIESKSRKGTGIKVNGEWVNGSEAQLAPFEWKQIVDLELEEGPRGKQIVSIALSGGGGAVADSRPASSKRPNNVQVGIEVGHAVNVATSIVASNVNVMEAVSDKDILDRVFALVPQVFKRTEAARDLAAQGVLGEAPVAPAPVAPAPVAPTAASLQAVMGGDL